MSLMLPRKPLSAALLEALTCVCAIAAGPVLVRAQPLSPPLHVETDEQAQHPHPSDTDPWFPQPATAPEPSAPSPSSDAALSGNTTQPDDAVGWGSPTSTSPDSGASTSGPPPSSDDAAGWGQSPAAVSGSPAPPPEDAAPSSFHIDLKLSERMGIWLARSTPSRIAQLRSALEVRASYSRNFMWGSTPASLRAAAGLRAEYDAIYLLSRDKYDRETLDAYELRFFGTETFLALKVGALEIKTGRLINTLGQGELQSAVDVLNPRDLRQVGATAIENLRLPAWTTRLALSDASFRLEAIIVHEAYFGALPPLLGNFSPVRKLLLERDTAADRLAEHNWQIDHVPSGLDPQATQFIGRYGYTGGGFDLDFYAGSVLDQMGVAALPSPAQFEEQLVTVQLFHPRYSLVALTGAKTLGDFVLRWELASHIRRSQSVRRLDYEVPVIETQRYTQVSGLLGFTYFGITDINFGAELMQSYVFDNPTRDPEANIELLWPVEAPALSLRYQHMLFDQRLTLNAMALITGVDPFNSALVNVGMTYVPRDGLSLALDFVHYESSSHFGFFYGFEKNDRVDLSVTWATGVL